MAPRGGLLPKVTLGRHTSPVTIGLTDAEPRACARMVEALEAVPAGTPARGWVTAMLYLPGLGSYDRYELRLCAERAGNGTVRLVPGSHD